MRASPLHLFSVAALSLFLLGYGLDHASVGTAYSDPVAKIRAQDETMYANMSVRLAREGGWLTPKVLGRYLLYKPPMLVWISGLSLKLFGTSLIALRLPALLAAVICTVLVFWMVSSAGSAITAWAAALLLLSNPLWHTFARLCYTDMLLTAAWLGSMTVLALDPPLSRTSSPWAFAICCAAGVMLKSTAGLLPFAVLGLYWILVDSRFRPQSARIALAFALCVALVAPWHIYQLFVHRQWFWTDYVEMQLLGFGFNPPSQSSAETQVGFYAKRLALTDPILLILVAFALPWLIRELRRGRQAMPAMICAWLVVTTGALLVFQYRNLPYALYFIPPACIAAALWNPAFAKRFAGLGVAALCLAFAWKCYSYDQPWGLRFGAVEPLPAVTALRSYYNLRRPNELVIIDPDDNYYATSLPLPRVRYVLLDPENLTTKYAPHYATLGITLTADQFEDLDRLEPGYEARLRQWGLNSAEPIGTSIVLSSRAMLPRLVQACRKSDLYLKKSDWQFLKSQIPVEQTHRVLEASPDHVLLLALSPTPGLSPPSSPLPARW